VVTDEYFGAAAGLQSDGMEFGTGFVCLFLSLIKMGPTKTIK
jgi:hypothetical protein